MRPSLDAPAPGQPLQAWFDALTAWLLDEVELVAGGRALRPVEVEVYLSAPGHLDPFAHSHPVQASVGRWYLHRMGAGYRGGSFKGLDLTFGAEGFGGVLLRTLRGPDGLVNGSSLCVDHLLACCGVDSPRALDAAIGGRDAFDRDSPLSLREVSSRGGRVERSARVGLTLKRVADHPSMPDYILRPYRALTDAQVVKKGRVNVALALLRAGVGEREGCDRSGASPAAWRRYATAYARGQGQALEAFHRGKIGSEALCALQGALDASARGAP